MIMKRYLAALLLSCMISACGSSSKNTDAKDTGKDISEIEAGTDQGSSDTADTGDTGQTDTAETGDAAIEADAVDAVPEDQYQDTAWDIQSDADAKFVPDIPDVVQPYPPSKLPFEYTRPPEGEPIPDADVTAFTKKVTGLWKKIDWFRWILRSNYGVDVSTGKADFLAWHGDCEAIKTGDIITFNQTGFDDNMWIPGSIVLSEAMNGYLLTGDWTMGKVAEQFCKGLTGTMTGFRWDQNDPAPWLMARAIFPFDHEFIMDAEHWKDDGRKKAVTYHKVYKVKEDWNAKTYHFPANPTWGDVWVRTMRSKDDVRAITRMMTFMPYLLAKAKDEWVKNACQETFDALTAFVKDTVDSGYYIRTKGSDGAAYAIPCIGEGAQDLGSYVCYLDLDPLNECCPRLASDLIAYGMQKTNDCGSGFGNVYDLFAVAVNYYNYPIIWDYHMAAIGNALLHQQNLIAWYLLDGLSQRVDAYMHPGPDEPGPKKGGWNRDLALLLVEAAGMGLPLTWHEASHVQKHWTQAVKDYQDWPNWDLWAQNVPDGTVQIRPPNTDSGVEIENLAVFLEYCNSPFKNPASVNFVDCDIVKDMSKWGTL
jgi:hypothetical protein